MRLEEEEQTNTTRLGRGRVRGAQRNEADKTTEQNCNNRLQSLETNELRLRNRRRELHCVQYVEERRALR